MGTFIALAAAVLITVWLVLLVSAWRLYRRDKVQRGADLQVRQWLRERSIRDVFLRRGPARLTYRHGRDGVADDD